jgi:hypothetical protein
MSAAQGEGIAMGSDVTTVSVDETLPLFALDTRAVSLDQLSTDGSGARIAAALIASAAKRSRIQVAGFYSAI